MTLVLASRSPRRAELLRAAGFDFTIRAADVDESPLPAENARDYVLRIAFAKACATPATPGETILAADTTVVLDAEIMGKPADSSEAERMLRNLSGKRHEVLTGICLKRGAQLLTEVATTAVWFAPLSDREIADYVASGEPMDKAGAYAIQGLASCFIDRIEGSYANVVGLPVGLVYRRLREWNLGV